MQPIGGSGVLQGDQFTRATQQRRSMNAQSVVQTGKDINKVALATDTARHVENVQQGALLGISPEHL